MAFTIGLDLPLKQGNTVHPYLVMNLKKEELTEGIKVNLDEKKRAELGLEEEYMGEAFNVIGTLFKKIVKVNIYVPGNFERYLYTQ